MKTNDYAEVKSCPICKKKVFTPLAWVSTKYTRPEYSTCTHLSDKPAKVRKDYPGRS